MPTITKPRFSVPQRVRLSAKLKFLSLSFLLLGTAAAEDARPKEVIAELTAAYARQGSYIATYQSAGEGKSLECTLGSDLATGLGVVHLNSVKGDQKREGKLWSAPNDRMFVDANGERFVIKGMNEESKSIRDLSPALIGQADEKVSGFIFYTPGMFLEKSSIGPSLAIRSKPQPPWEAHVEDASIQASDEKTVTLLTNKHGLLTINRENGMLLRQSLTGEHGEARVLELRNLQPNPGKEAVARISADWSTDGAEEKPAVAWMAPIRLKMFQLIIDSAERGGVDKNKLDERLEEQYEVLRHFVQACMDIKQSEGPIAGTATWPELFDKMKALSRDKWLEDHPGADATDDKKFLEYMQEPKVRLKLRNSMVQGMLEAENAPQRIMDDLFGNGGWASLKAVNDHGVEAKTSLAKALSRAYLETLIDMKMIKQWDQRDGLD